MNALRAALSPTLRPMPSPAPRPADAADAHLAARAIVPSVSPLSGKVRGLVTRHPEETLSVIRRWMGEKFCGD
jgi:hypothetical protein